MRRRELFAICGAAALGIPAPLVLARTDEVIE